MKTQSISSSEQSFNGKVYFLERKPIGSFVSENITEYIPQFPARMLEEIKKVIGPKPYDLFISETKEVAGFFDVSANINHTNIFGGDSSKRARIIMVNKNRPERFAEAAGAAMRDFERLSNYKEIVKTEYSFTNFIKGLFKRHKAN